MERFEKMVQGLMILMENEEIMLDGLFFVMPTQEICEINRNCGPQP